ncbi:F-box domain-containing protein [Mycena kentingensis (nom. inval.)]|nr:F-box domain-containing protein [Mycena kentingensis (nom. inval.)]
MLLDAERARLAQLSKDDSTLPAERLDAHKFPVLSIPIEITSEIFIRTLPSDFSYLFTSDSPQNLLGICSQWRAIALDTPALWCSVAVREERIVQRVEVVFEALRIWLARAGSLPLAFRMSVNPVRVFIDVHLASLLRDFCSRWEHLDLDIRATFDPISLLSEHAPRLRELHMSRWGIGQGDPQVDLLHAPLLDSVGLWDIPVSPTMLPWHGLTYLAILRRPLVECALALCAAPNLIYCHLDISLAASLALDSPRIVLAALTHLILKSDDGGLDNALDSFTLPALERMYIAPHLFSTDVVADLRRLLDRSGCKLRTLVWAGVEYLASEAELQASLPTVDVRCQLSPFVLRLRERSWQSDEWWDA